MAAPRKIVLNSVRGDGPWLEPLVREWIASGVVFVGVVGLDAAKVEESIDELCVGDGSSPYSMLTSSHPGENLQMAVAFAEQLSGDFAGPVHVVEF